MATQGFLQNTPLQKQLRTQGRFPAVSLQVKPIDPSRPSVELAQFTEYSFQTSVIVPVSAFSFSFVNPTVSGSLIDFVRDGDIAILKANGNPITTGIIDSVSVETEAQSGEVVHVQGRSLMGQLEDQSTVNDLDDPIWGNLLTIDQVVNALVLSTRINYYRLQSVPGGSFLFATEPGESKMSALMRYLEPLNLLAWMDPDGTLVVGKPDMGSDPLGSFVLDRPNRRSNVLGMKAVYSSTQIPNVIIPVWSGQESVQSRVSPEQRILNNAPGPKRLYGFQHRVPKTVVVSTPQGGDPQSLSGANQITIAGSNILQAYAKREIARANVNEVQVQVNIQGHYNDDLTPVMHDSTYQVNYPRAGVAENMYAHTVEYSLSREQGQKTSLHLCRLGSIVADTPIQPKPSARKQVSG
jgi:prophage tail gpP-like protein